MSASPKRNKLQPRLPRGFADRGPEDIRAVERMMEKIKAVYERYGFEPVETPFVEYTEALGKFLPDQDRPNEGVFSFQDDDEEWLSLRYDLTAPLARYVAQNFDRLPKPYRSYRAGWVFRNEKPGPGRFRQFMQFDADTVGAASVAADAEICMMAADTMEALGFQRDDYLIRVNNRKILDGVMETIGLDGEENVNRRLTVLRAIDKLDKVGIDGIRDLLGAGRLDQSGDFTKGANLAADDIDRVFSYIFLRYDKDQFSSDFTEDDFVLSEEVGGQIVRRPFLNAYAIASLRKAFSDSELALQGISELEAIATLTRAAGYGARRIAISSSVVRGLEYYTGPVFEAEIMLEVTNEEGDPVTFGAVGGGGRYDGLVGRFRGVDVPATGFSVGVSRLAAAVKLIDPDEGEAARGPVVVTVMDRERIADYQRMTALLREGLNRDRKPNDPIIPVEMYLGSAGMKAQLKYADRRNAPCVVIQGSGERDRQGGPVVQIKDLAAGKAEAEKIADHQAWRDERPGQFEVAEANLVAEVKKLLERQKVG